MDQDELDPVGEGDDPHALSGPLLDQARGSARRWSSWQRARTASGDRQIEPGVVAVVQSADEFAVRVDRVPAGGPPVLKMMGGEPDTANQHEHEHSPPR
jgi:hypothetical protein